MRLANQNLGDVARAGIFEHGAGDTLTGQSHRFGPETLGKTKVLSDLLVHRAMGSFAGKIDRDGQPGSVQCGRHAFGRANDPRRSGARADADQQPFRRRPRLNDSLLLARRFDIGVNALGHLPQRQLSQGGQIGFLKETVDRSLSLLRDVNLSGSQPSEHLPV